MHPVRWLLLKSVKCPWFVLSNLYGTPSTSDNITLVFEGID